MSGPVSYLQPGSPAADKIEVEMKLDGPEHPRPAGVGAALRPPWAAAPSAVALGAALGQARAMKREAGRADRPRSGPYPAAISYAARVLATISPAMVVRWRWRWGTGSRHCITLTLIERSLVCQAPGQVLKVNYYLIQSFL